MTRLLSLYDGIVVWTILGCIGCVVEAFYRPPKRFPVLPLIMVLGANIQHFLGRMASGTCSPDQMVRYSMWVVLCVNCLARTLVYDLRSEGEKS